MQPDQLEIKLDNYYVYFNSAVKKGYSGTACFTKEKPLSVLYDIGIEEHSMEGRVIALEFPKYYLVTVYTPNSQDALARLDYRMRWEDDFKAFLRGLTADKGVVVCGDLNVAHNEIDLKHPKSNVGNPGFSPWEREKFGALLEAGFVDSFRYLYPERVAYTWWSYRMRAREKGVGWRIDYFLTSEGLKDGIRDSLIYDEVLGSDHCPVGLDIDI